jgi:glycosyltransferase involved in cell wall biosynthesis
MVARYAERDGIARYADQLAASHGNGRTFLRVGIPEGPGDHPRSFHRGLRALWLLRDAGQHDDIVVHYHPHYFIRGSARSVLACHASWGAVGLLRRLTVVMHESDPVPTNRVIELARRWAWRRSRRLVFHSQWEQDRHVQRFGLGRRQELLVVAHGDFFSTSVTVARTDARRALDLATDQTIVLMIGFISASYPDKGYDRAIAAVRAVDDTSLVLHIVGSPIREGREVEALLVHLREASRRDAQIVLHEGYVDDETFDLWVRAADAVLTPYRTSSSSGVLARAHLLGTRIVTSDAGGLPSQAGPDDLVFSSDEQLTEILRGLALKKPR